MPRAKTPRTSSPGNPLLTRMTNAERRLDEHEAHLGAHDRELHEMDLDIAQLTDIVLRASRRARARLAARRRVAAKRGSRARRKS